MHTSEVLNTAADLIEERGWAGTNGQGWLSGDTDDPLCLEGAIAAAMGSGVDAYGGYTSGPNLCPAGQAVREYLDLPAFSISTALFMWNDAGHFVDGEIVPKRTATEVIATLRAAALVEAAKENTEARVLCGTPTPQPDAQVGAR